jgi:hypothetical protein
LFKHKAFKLLSSTTPACIKGKAPKKPRGCPRKTLLGATLVTPRESIDLTTNTPMIASLSTTTMAVLRGAKSKWDTGGDNTLSELLTTALALLRGASGFGDLYKAGTL